MKKWFGDSCAKIKHECSLKSVYGIILAPDAPKLKIIAIPNDLEPMMGQRFPVTIENIPGARFPGRNRFIPGIIRPDAYYGNCQ